MVFVGVVVRGANPSFNDFDTNQFKVSASGAQPRVNIYRLSSTNIDLVFSLNLTAVTNANGQVVVSASGGGSATNTIDVGILTNIVILTNGLQRLIGATTDTNVVNAITAGKFIANLTGIGTNTTLWVSNGLFTVNFPNGTNAVLVDTAGDLLLQTIQGNTVLKYQAGNFNTEALQLAINGGNKFFANGTSTSIYDQSNHVTLDITQMPDTTRRTRVLGPFHAVGNITNDVLAPGQIVTTDINRALATPVVNGAGAFTNNGSGGFGWYPGYDTITSVNTKTNLLESRLMTNGVFVLSTNGFGTNTTFYIPYIGGFNVNYTNGRSAFSSLQGGGGANAGIVIGLPDGSPVFNYINPSVGGVDAVSLQRDNKSVFVNNNSGATIFDQSNNPAVSFVQQANGTEIATFPGGASWATALTTIDPVTGKLSASEIDSASGVFSSLTVTNVSGPVAFITNTPTTGNGTVTMDMYHASDLLVTNAAVTVSLKNVPTSTSADCILIISNSLASGSTFLLTSSGFSFLTNGVPTRNAYLTNLTAKNQVAYLTVHCQGPTLTNAVLTHFYDP